MNTRSILSAALAAGVFLAPALSQAQSPTPPSLDQSQQAKIERLQAQVNALQAQVNRLHAQLRASQLSAAVKRTYQIPNVQIPNVQIPNVQIPNYQVPDYRIPPTFQIPGNQGFGGQGFGGQGFGGPGQPPQVLVPRIYSNIPPCSIIFLQRTTR